VNPPSSRGLVMGDTRYRPTSMFLLFCMFFLYVSDRASRLGWCGLGAVAPTSLRAT
jgi:hypothetical protein